MFDGARPKHAAKATRSGPFAKSRIEDRRLHAFVLDAISPNADAVSKINVGDLAGAHFSVLFRNDDVKRFDVARELRLAPSGHL